MSSLAGEMSRFTFGLNVSARPGNPVSLYTTLACPSIPIAQTSCCAYLSCFVMHLFSLISIGKFTVLGSLWFPMVLFSFENAPQFASICWHVGPSDSMAVCCRLHLQWPRQLEHDHASRPA